MLRRNRRIPGLVVALLVVLAACGGGEEGDEGGNDTTGDFGPASTVGNIAGMSAECESLTNLSIAMTSMFSGSSEEVDRLLEGVRDVPGAIADDVAVIQNAIRGLTEAWAEVGENPLTNPAALTEMSDADRERIEAILEDFNDEATNDAFDRIAEFAAAECLSFIPSG